MVQAESWPGLAGRGGSVIDPNWWWQNVHSGSEAIEAARELLANPGVLSCEDRAIEVMQVCSELIFRVTGEQITPSSGFHLDGNRLSWDLCSMTFADEAQR